MRRPLVGAPRLELLPLLDVVFLLLVVFIYAVLSMVRAHVIPVELPQLGTAEDVRPESVLVVSVDREGALSLAGEPVDSDGLVRSVRERRAVEPELSVLLNADADARHGDVARALDSLRRAGQATVLLVGRPEEDARAN